MRIAQAGEKPPEAEGRAVRHKPVEGVRPGADIPLEVELDPELGATRVVVFYREVGQGDYVGMALRRTSRFNWMGTISTDAVGGLAVQYYLRAFDARGRGVGGVASAQDPYLVRLHERPEIRVSQLELDDPKARERQRLEREAEEKQQTKRFDRLFIFAMPGFGFGYQPTGNRTEVAWQLQTVGSGSNYAPTGVAAPGGVTIAPFHFALEVGGLVTRHVSLSVLGRFQLLTGANADSSAALDQKGARRATSAVSGFFRARYLFLENRFHPFLHVDVGGGEIRHALDLSRAAANESLVDRFAAESSHSIDKSRLQMHTVCAAAASCTDSILLGYLFVGGGAGLWYDVAKHLVLLLDVNLLGALGLGPAQRGLNVDVQIGLGARFL
jgi:hypothetical protein